MNNLLAFIESSGAAALFLSAFISSTIAPGGSEALFLYLLAQQERPWLELLLVATAGNTLGALTTWLLGWLAALGYDRWAHKAPAEDSKALVLVKRWGNVALLFSWLPLIGDALCLAAGWLRLPFSGSLVAIAVGKLLRYAGLIGVYAYFN